MPIAIRGSGEPARPSAAVRLSPLPWCSAATILLQVRWKDRRPIPGATTGTAPLRKLSDTIARLAALQARNTALKDYSGAAGHLQALTSFGSNPGALRAMYHLPQNLPQGAPLVIVLHGCTQTATAYDHHSGWSKLAAEAGFGLLYPEQKRSNNPNLCFNWFQPADARRDAGEALSIRQMIEAMVVIHGFDRDRIFITGLSAGGAMAAVMLAAYPEVFSGGAIIAGLPYGSAATVPEAFDRMRGQGGPSEQDLPSAVRSASKHRGRWPKVSIWHGTADRTVSPSNAEAIATQWRGVHGLERTPTRSQRIGKLARRAWCDRAGDPLIEINMLQEMGHGTPIGDGLGIPGPYMLDVGISSTREIARFWGILDSERSVSTTSSHERLVGFRQPSRSQEQTLKEAQTRPADVATSSQCTTAAAPGVKRIIEDALRAAGLMS